MLSIRHLIAVIAGLLVTLPTFAARWIVEDANLSGIQAGLEIVKTIELDGKTYTVVETPDVLAQSFVQSSLNGTDIVPDYPIGLPQNEVVSDTEAGDAWHVQRLDYKNLPNIKNGKEIIVAVIDTGVDYTHKALAPNMWVNKGEIANNGIDDDNNGYIDDVHGYDFAGRDSDPMDPNSHGTHCAGVIAGTKDPSGTAVGIAPNAKIMAVRIIVGTPKTFLSDAAEGIKYAVDNGATVLSNSWRVYTSWKNFDPSKANLKILKSSIMYAQERGAIFVAAAGNESKDVDNLNNDGIFPVGFEGINNMVGVAASDQKDKPAYFSNYGVKSVHVAAPGVGIISTVPGNRWQAMSGTSMATPIVSGLLARGMSAGMDAPNAINRLYQTSDVQNQWSNMIVKGMIDPMEFLK